MQLVASVCRNDTIATNIAAAFLLVFWVSQSTPL